MSDDGSSDLLRAKKLLELVLGFIFVLATLKLIIGFYTQSIVLFADALNTLSDAFMALAAYFTVKILLMKPTEDFPYGYYRTEDLITLFLSVTLLGFAVQMINVGVNAVINNYAGTPHFIESVIILIFSSVSMYIFYKYLKLAAGQSGLTLLELSARDMKIDTVISLSAAASIIINWYYGIPLEGVATIGIGLLVVYTALHSGKSAILNLLDSWNRPEVISKIKEIIASTGVLKPGRVRLRQAGRHIFGDAQIYVPEDLRLEELDDLISEVESKIYAAIPNLKEITFDIEPLEENISICAIPIKEGQGRTAKLADSFDNARRFIILIIDEAKKIYDIKKEIKVSATKKKAPVKLAKTLEREEVDFVITKTISDVAYIILKGYSIDVYLTERDTVDEAVRDYLQNKLVPLEDLPQEET